jgi:hypothetical protein
MATLALACAACASGADTGSIGPVTVGASVGMSATSTDTDTEASSGSDACSGPCEPGERETRSCPGECAAQERICGDDCSFGEWSVCEQIMDACTPGETMSCGMCMQQTCGDDCEWGVCAAVECVFECQVAAHNDDEVCDDEGFVMPDGRLFLYCQDDNGGVAYVAHNTGPEQKDDIARCQGWEDMGLDAWDYLEYVHMIDCDETGKYVEITLPPGTSSHFGVHDQPDGTAGPTAVCVATLVE